MEGNGKAVVIFHKTNWQRMKINSLTFAWQLLKINFKMGNEKKARDQ